ncbi:MAG TPA: M23 family metallopeptidase [Allosphingosinicella sp.]|nr:M23 family metallopeptidase [Allosphingosinicella sp.]
MMTTLTMTNAGWTARFRNIFKPRDIFLHDGKSLRRFTIGAHVQMAAALAAFVLLAWSALATFAAIDAMNGDVARMERQVAQMQADVDALRTQTRQHAATLERRQRFLATMLRGDATADQLAAQMPGETHASAAVAEPYARVEAMQRQAIRQAREITRGRIRQAAANIRTMGLNPNDFVHPTNQGAMGGPLEEVSEGSNADPRFRELFTTWQRLDQLEQGAAAIPSAHPIHDSIAFTSGYGVRSDPFRGRAAMHAGIDLAGPYGTPIYATADGVVGRAEYNNGGYGNLVEINHGQGIQTRYGHLSRYVARAGQRVRRGELIGYMGSTGRSTGSHLHYEVRINGTAVNPVPFITQAAAIANLRGNAVGTPPAVGGPAGGPANPNR